MNNDDFTERFLEKGRERYEAGHKSELMYCLSYCFMNNHPVPDWLKQAFEKAYHAVVTRRILSWDEVFGRPLKKGKRLKTERRKMEITFPIWHRVRELHDAGRPIDKGLFAKVGKEFGVSGTVASELYYELKHEFVESEDDLINRK